MEHEDGLDEAGLRALVACFYAKVRADAALAPVFDGAVEDWPAHLDRLSAFWSSVMLTSGRYKGNPAAAHLRHAPEITPARFDRWLHLWAEATVETLPAAAPALQAKAARIAASLQQVLAHRRQTLVPGPARPPIPTRPVPPGQTL
jgi:hemoglobin